MRATLSSLALLLLLVAGRSARAEALTVEEVVGRAAESSPTLRAAVAELSASEQAARAAEAGFRPVFRAGVSGGHQESIAGTSAGTALNATDSVESSAGLSWRSPWGTELSGEVGAGWYSREVNRDPSSTESISVGSTYGASAAVGLSQPLLRGAGRDAGEAGIRAARAAREAASHGRDHTASLVLRDVLLAYWELWYATESLEVQRGALELARRQLDEAEARSGASVGITAPTEALRFASELASIEEALAAAEADRRARAIELGGLLGLEPAEAAGLEAAAEPPVSAGAIDSAALLAGLADRSAELARLEADLEAARSQERVARDATLPRLDLGASFAVSGLWNDETIAALRLPGDRPAIGAMVGLELELPLGNARARAELARARDLVEAGEARLEARRRELQAEVAVLAEQHEAARRRAELGLRTVEVATRLAESEQERLRLGLSTSIAVVDAQEALRATRLRRARAQVDLASTELRAEHLAGELLARHAAARVAAGGNR